MITAFVDSRWKEKVLEGELCSPTGDSQLELINICYCAVLCSGGRKPSSQVCRLG